MLMDVDQHIQFIRSSSRFGQLLFADSFSQSENIRWAWGIWGNIKQFLYYVSGIILQGFHLDFQFWQFLRAEQIAFLLPIHQNFPLCPDETKNKWNFIPIMMPVEYVQFTNLITLVFTRAFFCFTKINATDHVQQSKKVYMSENHIIVTGQTVTANLSIFWVHFH